MDDHNEWLEHQAGLSNCTCENNGDLCPSCLAAEQAEDDERARQRYLRKPWSIREGEITALFFSNAREEEQ